MPTISQLPPAAHVSAADEIPISQSGSVCAVSVAALLAGTQPTITAESGSLLGRGSLGPGGPEQVNLGPGVSLSQGTLTADGLDHASFSSVQSLPVAADIVISNAGTPMLMEASLLRGLFSAGENISITTSGTISASVETSSGGTVGLGSLIGALRVVTTIGSQDLVAVSHSGSDCAVSYGNFLNGVTVDQAAPAGPATDSDAIWVAQGSNVMTSQSLSAIWTWIASKLPLYRPSVVEVTNNIVLSSSAHNGRVLICSQPVTISPSTANMGAGFQCALINGSSGNVTLGAGFISSSGSLIIPSWRSAGLSCVTYSLGTIAFAAVT